VIVAETYDKLNRRTSLAAEIDGTDDLINNYSYDYLNRMTQVTQAGQSGGNSVAEKRVDFTYDAEDKGLLTGLSRYADTAGTELVASSSYDYDAVDRLTSLTHTDSGSNTLAGYTWTFDEANRLTAFTVAGYSTEDATYTHDDTDQLTGADRSGTSSDESYSYDANGNRTNTGYTTGDNNQLTTDGTYNYTYDDEGNLTRRTLIADSSYVEYEWDHRNRLISATNYNASDVKQQKVEYAYDINNLLIGRKLDSDGDGTFDTSGSFIYDGGQILFVLDDTGNVDHRLLWGPQVDQILADDNSSGDVYWALTDQQNTIRDWAEYDDLADTTSIVNHIAHDTFGNKSSETNSSLDVANLGYTARYVDEATGLQYNTNRWYNPKTARWMSQDPIGFDAGDGNLYRYVSNDPLRSVDPSGLNPLAPLVPYIPSFFRAASAGIGIGGNVMTYYGAATQASPARTMDYTPWYRVSDSPELNKETITNVARGWARERQTTLNRITRVDLYLEISLFEDDSIWNDSIITFENQLSVYDFQAWSGRTEFQTAFRFKLDETWFDTTVNAEFIDGTVGKAVADCGSVVEIWGSVKMFAEISYTARSKSPGFDFDGPFGPNHPYDPELGPHILDDYKTDKYLVWEASEWFIGRFSHIDNPYENIGE